MYLYFTNLNQREMDEKPPKKPLKVNVDTPNVDIEFNRNAEGERNLNIKVEKIPFFQKIKSIVKILKGKLK